jgi:hypothetical protein
MVETNSDEGLGDMFEEPTVNVFESEEQQVEKYQLTKSGIELDIQS